MDVHFWPDAGKKEEKNSPLVMNISARYRIKSLKNKTDIEKLLAEGIKKPTKYGLFFFGLEQREEGNPVEFAVLIKKTVGIAVWRNYCKRIVREYVRKNYDYFRKFRKVIFLYNYSDKINYHLFEKELNDKLKI